ncbi:MAG: hypothetical protein KBD51_03255 [Candidatus Levybacteria bacterium]|nr:hypothetical protein [Candidatus Levybacteria bacterium]
MSADRPLLYAIPRPPETGASLAAIGFGMFTRASLRCPASVTGQGAYIAREARELGVDIQEARRDLVASERHLAMVINGAKSAHVKAGVEVKDLEETARGVLTTSFAKGSRFEILPTLTLGRIIRYYDQIKPSYAHDPAGLENDMSSYAYEYYYDYKYRGF